MYQQAYRRTCDNKYALVWPYVAGVVLLCFVIHDVTHSQMWSILKSILCLGLDIFLLCSYLRL